MNIQIVWRRGCEKITLSILINKKGLPYCLIELHILVNCGELHELVNVVDKREYDGEQNVALPSKKCDLIYNSVGKKKKHIRYYDTLNLLP